MSYTSLLCSIAVILVPGIVTGQSVDHNPFSSKRDLAEGKRLYRLNCGVCHGMEGKTGRGARLAVAKHRHGNTDKELFQIIRDGIPGTEMPGLWMDDDAIWKILLVVRTFEAGAGEACESSPGDASRGRSVFRQKGSCLACHTVGMGGGRLGPDLTSIGLNYDREQLRKALLQPHDEVSTRYQAVRVVHQGKTLDGVLLNEDGYTLHMLDRGENLHSLSKEDLERIERPKESLMPAYGDLLSSEELDDLLAYMCTLRGEQ